MSLWLDLLGAEIRYVDTKTFGTIRIAEAGKGNPETIIFLHGINGHLEAYAKNIVPLSKDFHVVAFDYVGHGLSSKPVREYSPIMLAGQLGELMDALGIEAAHLSGESLGGWVSGHFAAANPHRVRRLMLNTAGGIPIVTDKGKQDLQTFIGLNKRNIDNTPTYDSVQARMHWLMHPNNRHLVDDELVDLRLRIYLRPESRAVLPKLNEILARHDEYLIPLDQLPAGTLFLWTHDNPIHDTESVKAAHARVPGSLLYFMKGDAAHWPQYEAIDEFNDLAVRFFKTGKVE
ncbi:DNA helicase RuvA [Burkholderia sp. MSh2]|uniref:Alpha/beta hydrolase fold protein n=1 Tax=Burkholderia paludis TaxID=1506587 RepID=A0A6J5F168_9BURK|nr:MULTISPECIES: alpha/beta fold hydrolase [Burkholderia]KEZ01925.1 DNA helicase RuvA [Burkholderia sp. MSh2]CAB3772104.1 4,5:9,10-diseco-3-hydroxy-5,9, 17-trioxoandrosta-1(10),2-diene-4-oate hydrolase [Burkholderia paludis]VWC41846.1 alpha/beta hydrolase fold protein [Burkholderia paludis]